MSHLASFVPEQQSADTATNDFLEQFLISVGLDTSSLGSAPAWNTTELVPSSTYDVVSTTSPLAYPLQAPFLSEYGQDWLEGNLNDPYGWFSEPVANSSVFPSTSVALPDPTDIFPAPFSHQETTDATSPFWDPFFDFLLSNPNDPSSTSGTIATSSNQHQRDDDSLIAGPHETLYDHDFTLPNQPVHNDLSQPSYAHSVPPPQPIRSANTTSDGKRQRDDDDHEPLTLSNEQDQSTQSQRTVKRRKRATPKSVEENAHTTSGETVQGSRKRQREKRTKKVPSWASASSIPGPSSSTTVSLSSDSHGTPPLAAPSLDASSLLEFLTTSNPIASTPVDVSSSSPLFTPTLPSSFPTNTTPLALQVAPTTIPATLTTFPFPYPPHTTPGASQIEPSEVNNEKPTPSQSQSRRSTTQQPTSTKRRRPRSTPQPPATPRSRPAPRAFCPYPTCPYNISSPLNTGPSGPTKGFSRKKDVERHIKSGRHLGEKVRCGRCGKDFARGDSLRRHEGLVHGEEGRV